MAEPDVPAEPSAGGAPPSPPDQLARPDPLARLRAGGPGPTSRFDQLRAYAETWAELTPRGRLGVVVALSIAVVATALLALWWWGSTQRPAADPSAWPASVATAVPLGSATTTTTGPAELVVHAAGAVVHPGVYRLAPTARVADLLDAAGGPEPDADLDRINLAGLLADGSRVFVPRLGEQVPGVAGDVVADDGSPTGSGTDGPPAVVDLNAADAGELDGLPGVGPATAAAIIEHRERNGPFASVDALLEVRGIGPAKLEALRDLVRV